MWHARLQLMHHSTAAITHLRTPNSHVSSAITNEKTLIFVSRQSAPRCAVAAVGTSSFAFQVGARPIRRALEPMIAVTTLKLCLQGTNAHMVMGATTTETAICTVGRLTWGRQRCWWTPPSHMLLASCCSTASTVTMRANLRVPAGSVLWQHVVHGLSTLPGFLLVETVLAACTMLGSGGEVEAAIGAACISAQLQLGMHDQQYLQVEMAAHSGQATCTAGIDFDQRLMSCQVAAVHPAGVRPSSGMPVETAVPTALLFHTTSTTVAILATTESDSERGHARELWDASCLLEASTSATACAGFGPSLMSGCSAFFATCCRGRRATWEAWLSTLSSGKAPGIALQHVALAGNGSHTTAAGLQLRPLDWPSNQDSCTYSIEWRPLELQEHSPR